MSENYCEVDDGRLYYELIGEGEPLVFLHGFTLDHTMWNEQVKFFSQKYMVVTYDMRGFGHSTLPTSKYSYQNDLKTLLDYLHIKKAHIVGLSLGGEEALNFTLDYPERVLSLTLVSSSLGGYISSVDWDVKAKEQGLEQAKVNWLNHDVFKSSKKYSRVFEQLKKMVDQYTGWHWINSGYRIRPKIDAINRLEEISNDVFLIVGELDLTYYHEIADILSKRIKKAKKLIISECGHMLTMENPVKFNQELSSFLSITLNQ